MILVDTSIWVDHLRAMNERLVGLLETGMVLTHPFVIGELALGSLRQRENVLTALSDLPPANTQRWVIRRKAEVVAAVRGGLLSLDEACERYSLTNEEFLGWQQSIDRHGMAGLRTTRLQQYR